MSENVNTKISGRLHAHGPTGIDWDAVRQRMIDYMQQQLKDLIAGADVGDLLEMLPSYRTVEDPPSVRAQMDADYLVQLNEEAKANGLYLELIESGVCVYGKIVVLLWAGNAGYVQVPMELFPPYYADGVAEFLNEAREERRKQA